MEFLFKWRYLLFICLLCNISPAFALIETSSMMVAVNVVGDCIISATPLVFGLYNPNVGTATDSTARLKVLCTLNTPYNIALDQGAGNEATTRLRSMSGPGDASIRYTLSQNLTHTINWGNIIGVDTVRGIGNGLKQKLVVYGEIPPKQNVGIGSYRDVVNVSIIF